MAFEDQLRSMILVNQTDPPSPSTTKSSDAIKSNRIKNRNGDVDSTAHKSYKQTRFTVRLPSGSAQQGMTPRGNADCSRTPKRHPGAHAQKPAYIANRQKFQSTEDMSRDGPDHGQCAQYKPSMKKPHATLQTKPIPPAQNVPVVRGTRPQYQRRNKQVPIDQASQINNAKARSRQIKFLQESLQEELPNLKMKQNEVAEKEAFHKRLSNVCENAVNNSSGLLSPVDLVCFGSLSSGYATAGSDIDLTIVPRSASSPLHTALTKDGLPRILEKAFLSEGIGARLLTKTRVPILKICESPSTELLSGLREVRLKWEESPEEDTKNAHETNGEGDVAPEKPLQAAKPIFSNSDFPSLGDANGPTEPEKNSAKEQEGFREDKDARIEAKNGAASEDRQYEKKGSPQRRNVKTRERPRKRRPNALDFPSYGVGTLCDINFSNPLAIQNTALLRCYSLCDPRVIPMVQYVKGWAKRRKVNSSYSGTLSSYGYVLMVLHYLINVANPPVLPNLQLWDSNGSHIEERRIVDRYNVCFWRNEEEISALAAQGKLMNNYDPLGSLLRDFFHYYAATGVEVVNYGFSWFHDALSLRTRGGLIPKKSKGWVAAKTSFTKNHVSRSFFYCLVVLDFPL